MRRIIIASFLLIICFTSFSFAIAPNKSSVCGSTLSALVHLTQNIQAKQYQRSTQHYLRNSLTALSDAQNRLIAPKIVQPDIPVGTWQFRLREKSSASALSRIIGLVEFMKTSEGTDPSKSQVTLGAIISGENDIRNFISELRAATKANDSSTMKIFINKFWKGSAFSSYVLSQVFSPNNPEFLNKLINGDPLAQVTAASLVLGTLILKQDAVLKRPLQWDFSFESRLRQIENFISSAADGSFLVSGQNYQMTESSVTAITSNLRGLDYEDRMANEAYLETPAFLDQALIKMSGYERNRPDIFKQGWVGIDWILEKRDGNVELLLVARYSQDRPIFPKRVAVKDENRNQNMQWEPGLVPIPIKIKREGGHGPE